MEHMDKNMDALRSAALSLGVMGASILCSLLLFIQGSRIESFLFPVWTGTFIEWDAKATVVNGMRGEVFGHRHREECVFVKSSALVKQGDVWRYSSFTVDGRPVSGFTRPLGWQSLGVWHFNSCGAQVRVVAYFSCHQLWTVTSTVLDDKTTPCTDTAPPT